MRPMSTQEFFLFLGAVLVPMLVCRCVPMFILKGRELSQRASEALNLIPAAAFAALVANDLLEPGMFSEGFWPAALPLLASGVVVVVARLSKSLVWSAVAGVATFALLSMI